MASDRLDTLRSMVAQDPKNTFARYGLAMELAKASHTDEALDAFRDLLEVNPDYVAAYYHAGRTLENAGRVEEARAMYERGLGVAARIGDNHTRSELQAALDLL